MPITPREIEDRFEDAALTLRRLPNPPGSGARGYGTSWPDYVQEAKHSYGYTEVHMRVVPSAADIQKMEDCIDWLRLVHPEDARIVWLRAEGIRWRQVCYRAGCVRTTAWRRWAAALLTMAKHLNAKEKSAQRKAAAKRAQVKPDQSDA